MILSKDLFLYPRDKRILITKKIKSNHKNQNILHYDIKKLKKVLNFLVGKYQKKNLVIKNLYNRKNGENNLKIIFNYKNNRLISFEGIFVNEDLKSIIKPDLRILMVEKVYNTLQRKIERIRDKKISIQLVITEFLRIHLSSFNLYLKKNNYHLAYNYKSNKFKSIKNGKKIQLKFISSFIKKHNF